MSSYLDTENKQLKDRIVLLETEVNNLKGKNRDLQSEIKKLTNIIDRQNEGNAEQILEHFHSSKSIRGTAYRYDMEMAELFDLIPSWDGCRDGLQRAHDYDDCRLEFYGRSLYDDEKESEMEQEELENRMRTPEPEEMRKIINDYKDGDITLYDLADEYDLKINNLFRLLKENKIIEKESDATDYGSFYIEYNGLETSSEWDGKSELGLIESFYKKDTILN